MCMARGQTVPPRAADLDLGTDADLVQLSKEPKVAVQPGLRHSNSSPWQGHQRAVFNALMVLFPNAINSQEFQIFASTGSSNFEEELHFHLGIPVAIQG
ncbi:hypothetical protein GW7_01251 [Heterocephalus glaber]|uniref:Uncharacterized protein n=1 Tax=Heterocephalus glaber TaxID=10181 RepID=G5BIS5_HETGA|nr:hypothetical protein GW7_01251 [Heterocephalus glaber]